MANFLSNLVQRFTQQAPAVQARPVSLFEPQTRIDLSPWVGIDSPNRERELPPAVVRTNMRSKQDMSSTLSDVKPSPRSEIEPRLPNMANSPEEKLSDLLTEGQPPQLGYLVVRTDAQKEISQRKSETFPEIDTELSWETGLEPGRAANPRVEPLFRDQLTTSRQKAASSKTGVSTIHPIQPQTRFQSLGQASSQPQGEHNTATSHTESVINVTIGRVEVIAKTPKTSTPSPKTKRPSPVISLDEYLKSRDQEKTR